MNIDFVYHYTSDQELADLNSQCVNAARWQLHQRDGVLMHQLYYMNGTWGDYVPQVAKQMAYRFLNLHCIDRRLRTLKLLAFYKEIEYSFDGDAMVLYLDTDGEEAGMAAMVSEWNGTVNNAKPNGLRFVLVVETDPK